MMMILISINADGADSFAAPYTLAMASSAAAVEDDDAFRCFFCSCCCMMHLINASSVVAEEYIGKA